VGLILREALASKGKPPEFKTVLDNAVKLVNFIKARPLNNRLISTLMLYIVEMFVEASYSEASSTQSALTTAAPTPIGSCAA
jgi:hypothetical protein